MSETAVNKKDEIDLIQVFIKIWNYRRFIIIFTSICIVLAILYALLAAEQYEAEVKLYKEGGEEKGSRMQALASQFGFGGGGSGSSFSVADLIDSRTINEKLIYKKWETDKFESPVNLIEFWEIEGETKGMQEEKAIKALKDKVDGAMDEETALITLTVLMSEPALAANVANTYTELITDYVQNERKSTSQQNIQYIKKRLKTVKKELQQAENTLKDFRKSNRVISSSPELQLQYGRLQRRVTIKQEVYLTLQKELEMAEIDLIKETPVINVLDEAVKPEKRAKPKRKLIVIIGTFLGFFLSLFIVVFIYVWRFFNRELKSQGVSLNLFSKK